MLAGGVAVLVVFMGSTGCQTTDRTAGRQLDDRIVNSKVKDALDDATVYKFPEVRTMTYNGVVQLSGFVETEEQKRHAAKLASKVEGVNEVINNISLKPTPTGRPSGRQQPTDAETKDAAPIRENK